MKPEMEPLQQPVRKVVGRFPAHHNALVRLAQLNAFVHKFANNEFPAGDLFPVRKVVGPLAQAGVDFAVVGGLAISLNGQRRGIFSDRF